MKTRSVGSIKTQKPAGVRDREIRADFDRSTIIVYIACSNPIADAALDAGKLVSPFSYERMTWIKPSFRWLMVRSHWATRPSQVRILALRIPREKWEECLTQAVLTDPDPKVYPDAASWEERFQAAKAHVQWDPERSLRGEKLNERSIQVGLSRALLPDFAQRWIREIRDLTAQAHKIQAHLKAGDVLKARRALPEERSYPLSESLSRHLGMV